jgi:hypothetical protein
MTKLGSCGFNNANTRARITPTHALIVKYLICLDFIFDRLSYYFTNELDNSLSTKYDVY